MDANNVQSDFGKYNKRIGPLICNGVNVGALTKRPRSEMLRVRRTLGEIGT